MGHPAGNAPKDRKWVGLPPRPFLYTADQIGAILSLGTDRVKRKYLWYEGRDIGKVRADKLRAVNIAPRDQAPEWRVSEQELIRWMKAMGFRHYERAWVE